MNGTTVLDFSHPDERRTFPHGHADIVHQGDTIVAKLHLDPGWHWEDHIKPIAGTDTCQLRHVGYLIRGRMRVVTAEGTEMDFESGQAYVIEPGHDAWTVGDEPVSAVEFSSQAAASFARQDRGAATA
jgi:hypothetical protein